MLEQTIMRPYQLAIYVIVLSSFSCNRSVATGQLDPTSLPTPLYCEKVGDNAFLENRYLTNSDYLAYLNYRKVAALATPLSAAEEVLLQQLTEAPAHCLMSLNADQKTAYATWKADRVNEYILAEVGVLASPPNINDYPLTEYIAWASGKFDSYNAKRKRPPMIKFEPSDDYYLELMDDAACSEPPLSSLLRLSVSYGAPISFEELNRIERK